MSGKQLAQRLAESRPALRVLFISGYTSDLVVQGGVFEEGVEFLQKPFTPDVLARRVRKILDSGGPFSASFKVQ